MLGCRPRVRGGSVGAVLGVFVGRGENSGAAAVGH